MLSMGGAALTMHLGRSMMNASSPWSQIGQPVASRKMLVRNGGFSQSSIVLRVPQKSFLVSGFVANLIAQFLCFLCLLCFHQVREDKHL